MIKRYEGKSIILAPLVTTEEALQKYLVWMNDSAFNFYIHKGDTVSTIETMRDWAAKKSLQKESLYFTIYPKESDVMIGTCSLKLDGRTNGKLGICIGEEEYREHGYGTDTIKTLIKFGFEEMGLHRLSLTLDANNERAHRCYIKAGLMDCGIEHETHWYHNSWHDTLTMELLYPNYNAEDNT